MDKQTNLSKVTIVLRAYVYDDQRQGLIKSLKVVKLPILVSIGDPIKRLPKKGNIKSDGDIEKYVLCA